MLLAKPRQMFTVYVEQLENTYYICTLITIVSMPFCTSGNVLVSAWFIFQAKLTSLEILHQSGEEVHMHTHLRTPK